MQDRKVIYLSPSVQHFNIGVDDYGSEEFRMNKITDIIVRLLEEKGYVVYRNNPEDTLGQVVSESNSIMPDIHVALHSNASGSIAGVGPEIYTNRPDTRADMLANDIYNEIINIYYDKSLGRGVLYTKSLYEIVNTIAPAVLLEIAFHDNMQDAKWIIQNEQRIAEAVVRGIDKYFNSINDI